jgi:protein phosphatase
LAYIEHFISYARSDEFLSEVNLAIKVLQKEKKSRLLQDACVNGGLIELKIPHNLVVVGDLHGDIKSLLSILQEIMFQEFLNNSNNKLIFLGDYIDRGSNSIEVLFILCYLKRKYPNSVILLCGNHEAMERFHCSAYTLPQELERCFGTMSVTIYDRLLFLFRLLPKVTIIENQLLLVHGGIPTSITQSSFKDAVIDENNDIVEELLWNDPRSDIPNNMDWIKSRREFGNHFGKNISKKYMIELGIKAIVRGHEPCFGFKIDHENTVLTIFSSKESYQKFDAAYVSITKDELELVRNASDLVPYVKKIKKDVNACKMQST